MSHQWLVLVISLPGRSGTPRMRLWRAVKASGAGILRDGVYVLPFSAEHESLFERLSEDVQELDGTAYVLHHSPEADSSDDAFKSLFDRTGDYAAWTVRAVELENSMFAVDEAKARRLETQLRVELDGIVKIDFFPGAANREALRALDELSARLNQHFSPDEPTAQPGIIQSLSLVQFQNQLWATRADLWVDRVTSAWLIQRHIDRKARFCWLDTIDDCPSEAIGFDFDGGVFSHVDRYVTFEVLLKSFALDADPALLKIAKLVHFLDVGGLSVPEATGFLAVLVGAKHHSSDDDGFAQRVFNTLDDLYAAFSHNAQKST